MICESNVTADLSYRSRFRRLCQHEPNYNLHVQKHHTSVFLKPPRLVQVAVINTSSSDQRHLRNSLQQTRLTLPEINVAWKRRHCEQVTDALQRPDRQNQTNSPTADYWADWRVNIFGSLQRCDDGWKTSGETFSCLLRVRLYMCADIWSCTLKFSHGKLSVTEFNLREKCNRLRNQHIFKFFTVSRLHEETCGDVWPQNVGERFSLIFQHLVLWLSEIQELWFQSRPQISAKLNPHPLFSHHYIQCITIKVQNK